MSFGASSSLATIKCDWAIATSSLIPKADNLLRSTCSPCCCEIKHRLLIELREFFRRLKVRQSSDGRRHVSNFQFGTQEGVGVDVAPGQDYAVLATGEDARVSKAIVAEPRRPA